MSAISMHTGRGAAMALCTLLALTACGGDSGSGGETTANDYDPEAQSGTELREVRVNLVLRTKDEDPRNPSSIGTGQGTENRVNAVPGDDGRRRRIHTATVRVRNVPAS